MQEMTHNIYQLLSKCALKTGFMCMAITRPTAVHGCQSMHQTAQLDLDLVPPVLLCSSTPCSACMLCLSFGWIASM